MRVDIWGRLAIATCLALGACMPGGPGNFNAPAKAKRKAEDPCKTDPSSHACVNFLASAKCKDIVNQFGVPVPAGSNWALLVKFRATFAEQNGDMTAIDFPATTPFIARGNGKPQVKSDSITGARDLFGQGAFIFNSRISIQLVDAAILDADGRMFAKVGLAVP